MEHEWLRLTAGEVPHYRRRLRGRLLAVEQRRIDPRVPVRLQPGRGQRHTRTKPARDLPAVSFWVGASAHGQSAAAGISVLVPVASVDKSKKVASPARYPGIRGIPQFRLKRSAMQGVLVCGLVLVARVVADARAQDHAGAPPDPLRLSASTSESRGPSVINRDVDG